MRFLYWCVGVMQILTGCLLAWSIAPAWRWVWIACAILWFFVGCTIGLVALAKLVAGKGGAGLPGKLSLPSKAAPQPQKEE